MTSPVELLFCKTGQPLSKLIMWGTGEPVSHLAIDIPMLGRVIHSDLVGLHAQDRKEFLDAHTIVATFKIWLNETVQGMVQQKLLTFVRSAPGNYNFPAFAHFAYRAALAKVAGIPLPNTNPWKGDGEYLCTEAAYLMNQAVVEGTGHALFDYDTELDAMTPWMLRSLLIANAGGKNEVDFRTGPLAGNRMRT